ncbi:hypothetical protein MRX96_048393 [Rhipicephalus microplus]
MRSLFTSLLVPLLAASLAQTQPLEEPPTTQRPDLCNQRELQEAHTLLRNAVARMATVLPESIPVAGLSAPSYTLYNGTLGPLRLTDVNVTAQHAVCRSDVRQFPFVIGVGMNGTMRGVYHYHSPWQQRDHTRGTRPSDRDIFRGLIQRQAQPTSGWCGVPYFDMMQAADRSFVPVFAKLPETHVLPALKEGTRSPIAGNVRRRLQLTSVLRVV